MVTMKDIATRAGTSRGTVDRVLNHRGKVAKDTEERILKVADEMGYRPNQFGRALTRVHRPYHIGFLYMDNEKVPFFRSVKEEAEKYVASSMSAGVEVEFIPYNIGNGQIGDMAFLDGDETWDKIQDKDALAMDGFAATEYVKRVDKSIREHMPLVLYNTDFASLYSERLAFVGCDYEKAGALASGIAALMTDEKGKIGIITDDSGIAPSSKVRIHGFKENIKKYYPQMKIVDEIYTNLTMDQFDFFERSKKMLEEHKEIDVIYLVNPGDYSLCKAVCRAWQKKKVRIITNDILCEDQRKMIRDGDIAVDITQDPEYQGTMPLILLSRYLLYSEKPERDWYVANLELHIRENT